MYTLHIIYVCMYDIIHGAIAKALKVFAVHAIAIQTDLEYPCKNETKRNVDFRNIK